MLVDESVIGGLMWTSEFRIWKCRLRRCFRFARFDRRQAAFHYEVRRTNLCSKFAWIASFLECWLR